MKMNLRVLGLVCFGAVALAAGGCSSSAGGEATGQEQQGMTLVPARPPLVPIGFNCLTEIDHTQTGIVVERFDHQCPTLNGIVGIDVKDYLTIGGPLHYGDNVALFADAADALDPNRFFCVYNGGVAASDPSRPSVLRGLYMASWRECTASQACGEVLPLVAGHPCVMYPGGGACPTCGGKYLPPP